MPGKYTVYLLSSSLDGRVFYVGKASRWGRLRHHLFDARRGHVCHKCNTIRKIEREGGTVIETVVFGCEDEAEAFALERALIASIGRDRLTNLTDGGDGASGQAVSPQERARRSVRSQAMWERRSPEERQRMAELQRVRSTGQRHTPEARQKMSIAKKGRPLAPHLAARLAAFNTGRARPTDVRHKISQSLRSSEAYQAHVTRRFGKDPERGRRKIMIEHAMENDTASPRVAVSITEAAKRLGITTDAVRKRMARGSGDGYKLNGHWYVYMPTTSTGQDIVPDSRPPSGQGERAVVAMSEVVSELRAIRMLLERLVDQPTGQSPVQPGQAATGTHDMLAGESEPGPDESRTAAGQKRAWWWRVLEWQP